MFLACPGSAQAFGPFVFDLGAPDATLAAGVGPAGAAGGRAFAQNVEEARTWYARHVGDQVAGLRVLEEEI